MWTCLRFERAFGEASYWQHTYDITWTRFLILANHSLHHHHITFVWKMFFIASLLLRIGSTLKGSKFKKSREASLICKCSLGKSYFFIICWECTNFQKSKHFSAQTELSLCVCAPVIWKDPNSDSASVCMRVPAFYLYAWVIGSSYVFHLSKYGREWQGVKLKLHPLSAHHNPQLCSSYSKYWLAYQNPNAASRPACVRVGSAPQLWAWCGPVTVGVFSPSISEQYSFEMWQLQIAHIMTAHRRFVQTQCNPPPFFYAAIPPLTLPFIASFFFHIYLFISYWRGKGLNRRDSFGCLIKIYNSSLRQMILPLRLLWSPIWEHLHLNWKARREIH